LGQVEDLEDAISSTVKHSLSALLATQIVPIPSTTLPMLFKLAFSSWARIEDLEDAISSTVKHSLSALLATQIVPVPSTTLPMLFYSL
jgi:hypothetical protein